MQAIRCTSLHSKIASEETNFNFRCIVYIRILYEIMKGTWSTGEYTSLPPAARAQSVCASSLLFMVIWYGIIGTRIQKWTILHERHDREADLFNRSNQPLICKIKITTATAFQAFSVYLFVNLLLRKLTNQDERVTDYKTLVRLSFIIKLQYAK